MAEKHDEATRHEERRFEVDPAIMKKVSKSVIRGMTEEEVEKIVKMRQEYVKWMHDNFAKKVLKPPKQAKELH